MKMKRGIRKVREISFEGEDCLEFATTISGVSMRGHSGCLDETMFQNDSDAEDFQYWKVDLDASELVGKTVLVIEDDSGGCDYRWLAPDEHVDENALSGLVPEGYGVQISFGRVIRWASDDIPLTDGSSLRFLGRSLCMLNMLLSA